MLIHQAQICCPIGVGGRHWPVWKAKREKLLNFPNTQVVLPQCAAEDCFYVWCGLVVKFAGNDGYIDAMLKEQPIKVKAVSLG